MHKLQVGQRVMLTPSAKSAISWHFGAKEPYLTVLEIQGSVSGYLNRIALKGPRHNRIFVMEESSLMPVSANEGF